MTEPINDQIRDFLERAMVDAPEPRTWADVERRAAVPNGPSSAPRRTGVWLAAACVIAVVAGFVVLIGSDDKTRIRTNDDTIPTTSLREELTPPPTIPSPTTAPARTGAETTTSTTTPEDEPVWRGGLLDDIDPGSFRPLSSVGVGDLIVPTAPAGWRLSELSFGQVGDDPANARMDRVEHNDDRSPAGRHHRTSDRVVAFETRLDPGGLRAIGRWIAVWLRDVWLAGGDQRCGLAALRSARRHPCRRR